MKIDNEVIVVNSQKINKITYRNSLYYIMNGVDISQYCTKSITEGIKLAALDSIVKLSPPMFRLVLVDDPTTTAGFVHMFCNSVLGKNSKQCEEIVLAINEHGSWEYEKSLPYEICHTMVTFLQNANAQTGNSLRWVIAEEQPTFERIESLVHKLIKRDYPEDNLA